MAKPDQWEVPLNNKYGKGKFQDEFVIFITGETAGNEFKGTSASRESLKYAEELGGDYSRLGYSIKVVMLHVGGSRIPREALSTSSRCVRSALTPSRALLRPERCLARAFGTRAKPRVRLLGALSRAGLGSLQAALSTLARAGICGRAALQRIGLAPKSAQRELARKR